MAVPNPGQPGGPPQPPPAAPRPVPAAARPQPIPAPMPLPPTVGKNPSLDDDDGPLPTLQPPAPRPAAAPRPIPAPRPILAGQGSVPTLRDRPDETTPEEELKKHFLKVSPPILISAVAHMILIIALGIWMLAPLVKSGVDLDFSFTPEQGQQMDFPDIDIPTEKPEKVAMIADVRLPQVNDPFSQPTQVDLAPANAAFAGPAAGPTMNINPALLGREKGMKQMLVGAFGGTGESENAVGAGLDWLAKQQQKNGAWSLTGPYTSGAQFENFEAATAMALLAFQAAGNSHQDGKFKHNVAAGLKHLERVQDAEGNFFQPGQRDEWLYTQAQCTIAVCELYGMTKDQELRGTAERAVKFCIESQDEMGGWRYRPRSDSDTSVTGWMVMALQSARMAGLTVPSPTLNRISEYLDKAATNEDMSEYGYLPGQGVSAISMTAEGLLCREYLGWTPKDKRLIKGCTLLLANLPRWEDRDVYYWYYATQTMFHMEGEYWIGWNKVIRDMLVKHQETSGRERGSWDPLGKDPDLWAQRGQGGRLYVTCLSLYMLEVYYRHLPLYSELKKKLTEQLQ